MKHPIRLIQITTAQDGNGRSVETEAASYNVYAELTKTGTGRSADNGQTQLQNTIRFKIPYRTTFTVDADWRLVFNGRQYTVSGITRVDERKFFLEITATASGKS